MTFDDLASRAVGNTDLANIPSGRALSTRNPVASGLQGLASPA